MHRPYYSLTEKQKKYRQFLKSEEWQIAKEDHYSDSRNNFCHICGGEHRLQVHHSSYNDLLNPNNLVTLCDKCHEELHSLFWCKELSTAHAKLRDYKVKELIASGEIYHLSFKALYFFMRKCIQNKSRLRKIIRIKQSRIHKKQNFERKHKKETRSYSFSNDNPNPNWTS